MKKPRSESTRKHSKALINQKPEGPDSAGQSGDTQGLSDSAIADSESVRELLEDGQTFEAEAVLGVENADDGDDPQEVRTKQFREDDVPPEYQDTEKPSGQ